MDKYVLMEKTKQFAMRVFILNLDQFAKAKLVRFSYAERSGLRLVSLPNHRKPEQPKYKLIERFPKTNSTQSQIVNNEIVNNKIVNQKHRP